MKRILFFLVTLFCFHLNSFAGELVWFDGSSPITYHLRPMDDRLRGGKEFLCHPYAPICICEIEFLDAGKFTIIYTAWATMMQRPSPHPRKKIWGFKNPRTI